MTATGMTSPNDPHEWLRRARSSALLARCATPGVDPPDLCFQAQQAAEKAVKAVLVAHGIIAPHTHDLAALLRRLEAPGVDIPTVVADARALTVFAVEARYPGHTRVESDDYAAALGRMDTVLGWASRLVIEPDGVRERARRRYGVSAGYVRDGELDAALLGRIVSRVVRACSPERVILFGSAARGEMHGDSDVDLLVVKAGDERPIQVAQAIYRELKGEVPVDVVVTSPEQLERFGRMPGLVYHDALAEGKVLYTAPASPA
jgi:HEPN domain-containing protein/predicted nucleotidyltransferase